MAGIGFSKKVVNWEHMSGKVKPLLEEFPETAPLQVALEGHITDAKGLLSEQEDLKARLRKSVRLRQEVEKNGEDIKNRLAAALQSKLGFRDEALIGFGIPVRTRRRRKASAPVEVKKGAAPAAPPAPAQE
jgi:hypothetical protein